MYTGSEFVETVSALGISHVVWLPDSALGPWESALEESPHLELVRICREGEAWPLAGGLLLGGKRPLVVMQTTGLFESGDAMRNILFDLKLPLFAVLGARSWLVENSRDSAKRFAEPILDAWGIDYRVIESREQQHLLTDHYRQCRQDQRPGAVLIAEGRL